MALLICCPLRLKNLTALVIGRHLVFDGHHYRVELAAAETKSGRAYHAALPVELTPYIDRWLRVHRPQLQSIAADDADPAGRLWLGRSGKPLAATGIRRQLEVRTQAAFGRHVWPHLFRACAVTELVDSAPEQTGIAPDLLGHAALRTTTKHYIKAKGMVAHTRVLEMIARRRAAASGKADVG